MGKLARESVLFDAVNMHSRVMVGPYPARMRRDARTHFMRQNTKP